MSDIQLYIYDISQGAARSMSMLLLGKQLEGIWHTAIVAWGKEYFFGSGGIDYCDPCGTVLGRPQQIQKLGKPRFSQQEFFLKLEEWSTNCFRGDQYDLLEHNCNTFSAHLSQWLVGVSIPAYITDLPSQVLNTPLGPLIRQFLDGAAVQVQNQSQEHHIHPQFQQQTNISQNHSGNTSSNAVAAQNPCRITRSASKKHLYKEPLLDSTRMILNDLSLPQSALLSEIVEFCDLPASKELEWSIGPSHLKLLDSVVELHDDDNCTELAILDSLRLAASKEQQVLSMDRAGKIKSLVERVASSSLFSSKATIAVAQFLCNSLQQNPGLQPLDRLPAASHITSLTLKMLQSEEDTMVECGAHLVQNVSDCQALGFDEHLELGSCIIELLSANERRHVLPLVSALRNHMHSCADLIDLASTLELDLNSLKEVSDDAKEIQEKMSCPC